MSDSAPTPEARLQALLQRMEHRAPRPAGELPPRTPPPENPPHPRSAPFERFFPHAQHLPAAAGPGACRRIETTCPPDGTMNRAGYVCPLAPCGGFPTPQLLARLTGEPDWAGVDPARIAFVDVETTALSSAAGTYAFLIGVGWLMGQQFAVEQFFMEDFADEPALVEAVERALAPAQAVVSYNGRTFDLPVLATRWRMNRRRPWQPRLHLDLLHYARRLWSMELPDCTLGTIERAVLGLERPNDIEGALIPRIYLDFIRGARPERLVPVFDHHAQDIFSLAALLAAVARAFAQPEHDACAAAGTQWGVARLFLARGENDAALAAMERAVLAARDEARGFRFSMHLARAYRRAGRTADAVDIWHARAAQARADRLDPLVELAKLAVHALKDLTAARAWTRTALELLLAAGEFGHAEPVETDGRRRALEELQHRLARLDRRLARPTGPADTEPTP